MKNASLSDTAGKMANEGHATLAEFRGDAASLSPAVKEGETAWLSKKAEGERGRASSAGHSTSSDVIADNRPDGRQRQRGRGREGAANGGVSSEVEAGKGKRGAELGMHGRRL